MTDRAVVVDGIALATLHADTVACAKYVLVRQLGLRCPAKEIKRGNGCVFED